MGVRTVNVRVKDLPEALRRFALFQKGALRKALHRTAYVDSHRWIQWSIRGGGRPQPDASTSRKPSKKSPRKKRGKKSPCPRRRPPNYRKPVDTGDYARSWMTSSKDDRAEIYSLASPPAKAGVIENGRKPAWIPIEPLTSWVQRKLGCQDAKQARQIAFMISRAASKKKRPGLKVLGRAHPKIAQAFAKNLRTEIRRSKRK